MLDLACSAYSQLQPMRSARAGGSVIGSSFAVPNSSRKFGPVAAKSADAQKAMSTCRVPASRNTRKSVPLLHTSRWVTAVQETCKDVS
jgi:hypothetical protein